MSIKTVQVYFKRTVNSKQMYFKSFNHDDDYNISITDYGTAKQTYVR